jgi:hypothetical protein
MAPGSVYVPISFPIRLATAPTFVSVKEAEDKTAEGCPGKVLSSGSLEGGIPLAGSGKLCVYLTAQNIASQGAGVTLGARDPTKGGLIVPTGTSTSGILLKVTCAPPEGQTSCTVVKGVWAVTG